MLEIDDKMSELEEGQRVFEASRPTVGRRRKVANVQGAASENQINAAIGLRQKVPQALKSTHNKVAQSKKAIKRNNVISLNTQDKKLLDATRKLNFDSNAKSHKKPRCEKEVLSESAGESDNEEGHLENNSLDNDTHDPCSTGSKLLDIVRKCPCGVCKELKAYDCEATRLCLKMVSSLFKTDESQGIQYLELLKTLGNMPVVELTKNTGIFMTLAMKNQIKIDCKDQPSKMIRDTLFALYGREPFFHVQVTARGNKSGTYGIHPRVLTAILGFVNRNVTEKITQSHLVLTINKRAIDWRKREQHSKKTADLGSVSDSNEPDEPESSSQEGPKPTRSELKYDDIDVPKPVDTSTATDVIAPKTTNSCPVLSRTPVKVVSIEQRSASITFSPVVSQTASSSLLQTLSPNPRRHVLGTDMQQPLARSLPTQQPRTQSLSTDSRHSPYPLPYQSFSLQQYPPGPQFYPPPYPPQNPSYPQYTTRSPRQPSSHSLSHRFPPPPYPNSSDYPYPNSSDAYPYPNTSDYHAYPTPSTNPQQWHYDWSRATVSSVPASEATPGQSHTPGSA